MSAFIIPIIELSQNFFNSDPLKFNQYFAITPDYQKYCLTANLPTRFTITLAKEAMLIHDIAIHLLAGGYKLTTSTVKGICAIASGILGLETDHQTPSKQAAIHIGFACAYTVDFFVSIANINKRYPQHLVNKIETIFTDFLKISNKNVVTKNIIVSDPEIEQELKITREELEKRDAAFNQLEKEIEKTAQKLRKPSQCEKIVDEILHPDINAILAKASIKNNQEQPLEITHTAKQKVNYCFESDDGFWSEETFSSSDTFNSDSIPFKEQNKFSRDTPLTTSNNLESSKMKSTLQVSKRLRKKIPLLTNNSLQISAFERRNAYSEKIRSHSKKTLEVI
ncbi:hypothetical protein [Candidatus Rhabdochlamydia porcellionis]|jgi:hypothetical protein|uniref:Uncharacterized protein n=1 Tax=Candidatus Rhabdochlamydia porcellionis TaxID=225148 RepID=A0ABX8Z1D9_9BACT|nr:hypothetical protein [Candidatus Rhabdochlamydia porcellionis]QZA58367.1 hypothetical protein RHAB15C_0000240 [Candidatus Rhabdochlamydia porcellionis]